MALVLGGVVRTSVIGRLAGELCVNVFDVHLDDGGGGTTRAEECYRLAGDVLNNWHDHILPILTNVYVAEEVRWVDLDSATGSSGGRSTTSDKTWPAPGSYAGANPAPNNTYYKVWKNLQDGNRQSRRGMVRLGGVAESSMPDNDPNVITPLMAGYINDAFEDFKDGINGDDGITIRNLCVVSLVEGQPPTEHHISTFEAAPTIGTLRRRMPGVGA